MRQRLAAAAKCLLSYVLDQKPKVEQEDYADDGFLTKALETCDSIAKLDRGSRRRNFAKGDVTRTVLKKAELINFASAALARRHIETLAEVELTRLRGYRRTVHA